MHNLLDAKRAGAPLSVHAVTVQQLQGINARPGIPQVRRAKQARPPRVGGANRGGHRQNSPDAGQGAAQPIDARQVVRQVALVKQEPLLYSKFRNKADGSATMNDSNGLNDRMTSDFEKAREKYEIYGKFYASLSRKAKEYLENKSREYKRCLTDIQRLILPVVKEVCPTCEPHCCRLSIPERSIYIAGSVGGFDLHDYLLSQCNTRLPDPDYENAKRNLCPFWEEGCTLPMDCRSYLCIQYFCDELKRKLDMKLINEHLRKIESVLSSFSIAECML